MDPTTIAAAGQFLGGVGSIAGAFGGSRGPSANDSHHAMLMGIEGMQRQFDMRMDLAKKHGLHPLTVAGVPMTPSSVQFAGDSPRVDLEALGSGAHAIGRSLVKPPDEDPMDKRLKEAQLRLIEANANRAEWDALAAEFTTADLARGTVFGQPGLPPNSQSSNDVNAMGRLAAAQSGIPGLLGPGSGVSLKQEITPPHPNQLGTAAGAEQLYHTVFDQFGKPVRMLNPKALQGDTEIPFTYLWLANRFGNEAATNLMPIAENAGPLGAGAAALGYAAKKVYDYFGNQRREVEKRRGFGPGRGRSPWRAAPRGSRSE